MERPTFITKVQRDLTKIVQKTSLENTVRFLAGVLIAIIICGFLIGFFKTLLDLKVSLGESVQTGLRQLLIDSLSLLAVIEIIRTVMYELSF